MSNPMGSYRHDEDRPTPYCSVVRPTDQSVNNDEDATVDFTSSATIEADTHDMFSTSAPTILTVVVPGVYMVTAQLYWASDADGYRSMSIRVGSTVVAKARVMSGSGAGTIEQQAQALLSLDAGDTLSILVHHTAGAALNLTAVSYAPRLSAAWIRSTP